MSCEPSRSGRTQPRTPLNFEEPTSIEGEYDGTRPTDLEQVYYPIVELDVPDDLKPWISAKADLVSYGRIPEAIIWLLREAQALEDHRQALRFYPYPPRDLSDAWSGLAEEARIRADGR